MNNEELLKSAIAQLNALEMRYLREIPQLLRDGAIYKTAIDSLTKQVGELKAKIAGLDRQDADILLKLNARQTSYTVPIKRSFFNIFK